MYVKQQFKLVILAMIAGLGAFVSSGMAEYIENWDIDPPANNDWYYYDVGVGDGDADLTWVSSGGEDGSAHVRAPLGSMTEWTEVPDVWWGPYTYGHDGVTTLHPINLNDDRVISIYARDDTLTGDADLQGGSLHFWIGQFRDPDGPGGDDPFLTFFQYNDPVKITGTWSPTRQVMRSDPGRWTEVVNDDNLDPVDLFTEPQQWGFGIFGASGAPSGVLGFDSFANTPEPTAAILLVLGVLLVVNRRRR
jgi:hypothetical protein